MISIQRHVLSRLLPGIFVIWFVAGSTMYWHVRREMVFRLDQELLEIADALPFGNSGAGGGMIAFEEIAKEDFGIYFQIRTLEGDPILKSESLGRFALPRSNSEDEEAFSDARLGNGDRIRMYFFTSYENGGLGPLSIAVARSREEVDGTLFQTAIVILALGFAVLFGFAILLRFSLRSGLEPLRQVGIQASEMNPQIKGGRYPEDSLPAELKPIVRNLNIQLDRIEEGLERERRFGSDLAHELRNPVAALRSNAEVALKWPEKVTEDVFVEIGELANELHITLDDMLTLARIETRKARIRKERLRVRQVVELCVSRLEPDVKRRRLSVEIDIDPGLHIETDESMLRTIVSNLIGNAVEYSPEGSTISLTGRDDGDLLVVSNQAVNLCREDLPKLFERMWRGDPSRTDSTHSGLGLSISLATAEALRLSLNAQLDDDSVLHIRIGEIEA